MRLFGTERIASIMDRLGVQEGEVIEHSLVTRSIGSAQKRVEVHNFEIRKHLLEYDDVMNQQREVIYGQRQAALKGDDLKEDVIEMIEELVAEKCEELVDQGESWEDWPLRQIADEFEIIAMQPIAVPELGGREPMAGLVEHMTAEMRRAYDAKEAEFTPDLMRQVERFILMRTLDAAWRDHLYEVDHLREGIGWQSVAGKDPLIEYKREAFRMIEEALTRVRRETVRNLFKVSLVEEPETQVAARPPVAYRHEAVPAYGGAVGAQVGPGGLPPGRERVPEGLRGPQSPVDR